MKEVLKLHEIWKSYILGKIRLEVLKGLNFTIHERDFIAIMGPSGSGKSTLLNLLGLLDKPTKGSMFINGQNITYLSKEDLADVRSTTLGFIFQQFNLIPHLSSIDNICLPYLFTESKTDVKAKAHELLEAVGLKGKENNKPSELSGGEQQRIAIARALINDPKLILADEPTGNLDSKTGEQIIHILKRLNDYGGKTIVMVTHDPIVADHAKKTIHLKDGVIVRTTDRKS